MLLAAHEVPQDGFGVAGFDPQALVVKLPVLGALVEVGVGWGREGKQARVGSGVFLMAVSPQLVGA